METIPCGVPMKYLQFWDKFNWELYVKILEAKLNDN
jgi:hypothetical protein